MTKYNGVVIDYGHGGQDPETGEYLTPGEKQYTFTDHDFMFIGEGIVNRKIASILMGMLLSAGVSVVDALTGERVRGMVSWRDLEQTNVSLADRVKVANRHGNYLFVSIHSNAIGNEIRGPSKAANGATVFTSKGQTRSDVVATSVIEAMKPVMAQFGRRVLRGDWEDGDHDHEANFYVLRKTRGSAILGEILFYTNYEDALVLKDPDGQWEIAKGYFEGIIPFLHRTS